MTHLPDHYKMHTINPDFVLNISVKKVVILNLPEFLRQKLEQIISKNYHYMKIELIRKQIRKFTNIIG